MEVWIIGNLYLSLKWSEKMERYIKVKRAYLHNYSWDDRHSSTSSKEADESWKPMIEYFGASDSSQCQRSFYSCSKPQWSSTLTAHQNHDGDLWKKDRFLGPFLRHTQSGMGPASVYFKISSSLFYTPMIANHCSRSKQTYNRKYLMQITWAQELGNPDFKCLLCY